MGGWSTKAAWAGWAAGSTVGSKLWVLHLLAGDPRGSWDLSGLSFSTCKMGAASGPPPLLPLPVTALEGL